MVGDMLKLTTMVIGLAFIILASGCGGDDDSTGTQSRETIPAQTNQADGSTSTTTATTSSTDTAVEDAPDDEATATGEASAPGDPAADGPDSLPEEIKRTDLLTIANGLTLASFEGESTSASNAVRIIDGEPSQIGFGTAADEPIVYVFELPALTTFDRFAVPDTRNSPGNTTFFGAVEIAGSATSATDGFEILVSEAFVELEADQAEAEYLPAAALPVRWIRITLSGALQVEAEHGPDRTTVRFSELIGNGTQESVPLADGFDGVWELTFADNPNGAGELTELRQEGARVIGCVGFAEVSGTVAGNVVRLNGIDTRNQRPSAYLFVVDGDGQLRGMESTNNGVFRARIGRVASDGTTTDCSRTAPEPLACGSIVYVNFDLDSAVIRPDSTQVIDDLFDGLSTIDGDRVLVEGHTSTEGATDYNQDLSERRAQAVVDALVTRGLPAEAIAAVGKGESEPLVSERDEASRAINRRVEIDCLS